MPTVVAVDGELQRRCRWVRTVQQGGEGADVP